MPVEFLGIAATNDGSEITARSGASFDKDNTLRPHGRTRRTAGTGRYSLTARGPPTRALWSGARAAGR